MGNRIFISLIFLFIIIVWLLGYFTGKKHSKIIEKTVTRYDTVYVKSKPEIIYKEAILTKIDTVIKRDTVTIRDTIKVAYADTTFKEGELKAWYYFPPVNTFKFDWRPYPQPIITKEIIRTIEIKPAWYENKYLWGIAGLCLGIAIK